MVDRRSVGSWSGRIRRWLPVFGAALAIRIVHWVVIHPHWVPQGDADQYVQLARNLADGLGFSLQYPQMEVHPTAFRPPLYPFLLTPGSLLFGDALWPARLFQAVLGSVVVVLAGVVTARIGGRRAGYLAAGLVAVHPALLANDTVTLTEPLALGLLLAAVLLVDDRRWIWAGVAGGLLLLTRPNGYLAILVLAWWAARSIGWRPAVGLAAISGLVLAPWLVRNHEQVGTWRTTTSDGFTMAAVYGVPAQEVGHFIDPTVAPEYADLEHRLVRFDEAAWNDMLLAEAIEGLRDNPGHVVHTFQRNARGYFEISPSLNRYPEVNDGRHMGFRRVTMPIYWLVTTLGLVGLVRHRQHRLIGVLALLVGQFVVLSLLLVAPPRLRAPFDLLCCIGAGLLLAQLAAWWSKTRRPSPV
jgi:4-amino-4-deoxy-L-arabinose transferase-like glycosyltransferase